MVGEIVLRIFICTNYHHKVCTLTPCEFSTCSGEETIEGVVRYYNNKLKDISKSNWHVTIIKSMGLDSVQ